MIVKTWEQFRDEFLAQLRQQFPDHATMIDMQPGGYYYKGACQLADRLFELQKLVIDQHLINVVNVKGEVSS